MRTQHPNTKVWRLREYALWDDAPPWYDPSPPGPSLPYHCLTSVGLTSSAPRLDATWHALLILLPLMPRGRYASRVLSYEPRVPPALLTPPFTLPRHADGATELPIAHLKLMRYQLSEFRNALFIGLPKAHTQSYSSTPALSPMCPPSRALHLLRYLRRRHRLCHRRPRRPPERPAWSSLVPIARLLGRALIIPPLQCACEFGFFPRHVQVRNFPATPPSAAASHRLWLVRAGRLPRPVAQDSPRYAHEGSRTQACTRLLSPLMRALELRPARVCSRRS